MRVIIVITRNSLFVLIVLNQILHLKVDTAIVQTLVEESMKIRFFLSHLLITASVTTIYMIFDLTKKQK